MLTSEASLELSTLATQGLGFGVDAFLIYGF